MNTPHHGGRRAGSGRKPDPNKKQNVTVRLPPWLADWLRAQPGSKGLVIERALRNYYQIDPPED